MKKWKSIADIRREYGDLELDKSTIDPCPFNQFEKWFNEVLESESNDPTAMVLSTVDISGNPDSRVVLLKGLQNQQFVFYTNYQSDKACHLANHPNVSLNFYWPQMSRQVRIRGQASVISEIESDTYFASRPIQSQIAATVSPQSHEIESRKTLEDAYKKSLGNARAGEVSRPDTWGGYQVQAFEFEFWQGRDNRLHDRIKYLKKNNTWYLSRLAP